MTNWDLFEILNFTLRKNGRSEPITPERFLLLLKQENLSYFKQLVPLYSQDQKVADSLSPFEVMEDVTDLTTTTNTITLPTDYAHFIGMYYTDTDSNVRAFDLVTDDEWDMRMRSTITIPSNEYPICKIVGSYIYVAPSDNGNAYGVVDWDGVDDYINFSTQPDIIGTRVITFSIHVNSLSGTNINSIIYIEKSAPNDKLFVYIQGNYLKVQVRGSSAAGGKMVDMTSFVGENVDVQINKATGDISQVLINGSSLGVTLTSYVAINATRFMIGNYPLNSYLSNALIWDININDEHFYSGQPSGNLDAAWIDSTDSINGSVVGAPTTTNAIGSGLGTEFYTSVLYYIKYPISPTFDSSTETGTDLEWKEQDQIKILARILRTMGIRTNEKQLFELGQQQKLEA